MHYVAAESSDWHGVAVNLGLAPETLGRLKDLTSHSEKFAEVFIIWKKRVTRPYTWSVLIEALRNPLVGEVRLAEELQSKLTH